jgi:putative Holliday junction resolvase
MSESKSTVHRDSADAGRVLGIDFGSKRVGVAVSDPMGIIAQGIDTFPNDRNLPNRILDLAKRMSVTKIVIGKPLKLNGEEGNSAIQASEFTETLKEKISKGYSEKVEIVQWDERFTTTIAQRTQIELGIKKKERQKKGNLDRMASQLILQSYLDSHR